MPKRKRKGYSVSIQQSINYSIYDYQLEENERALRQRLDCVSVVLHLRFLFIFIFIEKHMKMLSISGSPTLCTGPTTSLTNKISGGQCCPVGLCTIYRTQKPLFSTKLSLKMGPTALFTHLKIIILQYFQFSAK